MVASRPTINADRDRVEERDTRGPARGATFKDHFMLREGMK